MALSLENTKNLLGSPSRTINPVTGLDTRKEPNAAETPKKKAKHDPICSVEGCGKPYRARGLCITHYQQWRKENIKIAKCSIAGCENSAHSNGLCASHLYAQKFYGDPNLRNSLDDVSSTCIFNGGDGTCGKTTKGGGRSLCRNHYQKLFRIQKKLDSGSKVSPENQQLLKDFWSHKVTNRSNKFGARNN